MKKLLLALALGFIFVSCDSEPNACLMSEDYIKETLNYPNEAEMGFLSCNQEKRADGSYRVLRKITASNAFGVTETLYYEVILKFNGGNDIDQENWELISIRSEREN